MRRLAGFAFLTVIVGVAGGASAASAAGPSAAHDPVLLLHGGAGSLRPDQLSAEHEQAYREAMVEALGAGWRILSGGGSSLDAVEATVRWMEDSPLFNAGRGAVLNAEGRVQLDASIMEGGAQDAGAVAAVARIKNPIIAARAVMEQTPHVLLVGRDADLWAAEQGLATVNGLYYLTPRRLEWLRDRVPDPAAKGTVGAVALDSAGHLAAATSTGGLAGKLPGRVGDSPIPGAGTWADAACAVSGTGQGEFFIRFTVAREICSRAGQAERALDDVAREVVLGTLADEGAEGGVIALLNDGTWTAVFNTSSMLRGHIGGDGIARTWFFTEAEP